MSAVSTFLLNADVIPKTPCLGYFQKGFQEFVANRVCREQKPMKTSWNLMFWETEDFECLWVLAIVQKCFQCEQ